MRVCWEAAAGLAAGEDPDAMAVRPTAPVAGLGARPALTFVEVASGSRGGVAVLEREAAQPEVTAEPSVAAPLAPVSTGWTLWGDAFL